MRSRGTPPQNLFSLRIEAKKFIASDGKANDNETAEGYFEAPAREERSVSGQAQGARMEEGVEVTVSNLRGWVQFGSDPTS